MLLCFAVILIGTNGTYREEVYNFTPSLPTIECMPPCKDDFYYSGTQFFFLKTDK